MEHLPPAYERRPVGLARERRDERAHERDLRHGHAHVGWHLERAQLDEALAAVRRRRVEELVDADLGAVRVARDVDEEMAEERVAEPRRRRLRRRASNARARAISSS